MEADHSQNGNENEDDENEDEENDHVEIENEDNDEDNDEEESQSKLIQCKRILNLFLSLFLLLFYFFGVLIFADIILCNIVLIFHIFTLFISIVYL